MSDFWDSIKKTTLPVVLYGTGDAADKLISIMNERGIRISGVFASSGFVRERTFHSFKVLSYENARRIFSRMAVVMAFGTQRVDVIESIKKIADENEFYLPSLLLDESNSPFDRAYYEKHEEDFQFFRSSLTDERSREVYDAVISFRLSGNIYDILPVEEDDETIWRNISYKDDDTFVDIGAYDGDTVLRFLKLSDNRYRKIIAIEPDGKSFKKAEKNLEKVDNLTLYNTLLSDNEELSPFISGRGRGNTTINGGDGEKRATTLDLLLHNEEPTIIKIDAEGAEEKILDGGRRTIARCKPKIILSVYHRIDDFYRLLRKVKEINPSYSKFTLRLSYSLPDWDIVLIVE